MENKNVERYLHFLVENNSSVYVKEKAILDVVRKYHHFEINGDNQDTFVDDLKDFISKNQNSQKLYIIVNVDEINIYNQRMLSYMVKDKSYQALSLPRNAKIIVTGDVNNMNKELFGLLVVINV